MAYRIYVGSQTEPDYYFEQKDSFAAKVTQKVALVGKELTIDTFEPVVQDDITNLIDAYHFRSSDGQEIETGVGEIFAVDVDKEPRASDLINLEYGTPVWYFWENTLIGKFYVSSIDRTAKNKYLLHCVSVIGLLEKMQHGGGLFLATTFQAVLSHILASDIHGTGSEVINYRIDDDVATLPVSGWMGKDTKRNNLYKLMFANGVNIVKDADGEPRFTFIYTAPSNPETIPVEEIYDAGTQEYEKPYSRVSITEHTYTPLTDQDPATLFDNTSSGAVTNEEIWFTNAPVIVSTITAGTGLVLISATENSAIVSGAGKLTGIPYTHTTRMLESVISGGDSEKTVRVENCTMVNLINSTNLLARLRAYYQPNGLIRTIHDSIVYTTQRAGKAYRILTPFDETETAYLTKMDINASEVFKADCEWRANYDPAGQEGLFDHVDVIIPDPDHEGDWIVPDGVTKFKVVIIGGGSGGSSGWPGKNGKDARTHIEVESTADLSAVWYGAEGGDGGAGGAGGTPGRVKIVTVENATPGATYHWTLGTGGDGGAATGYIPDTVAELREAMENEHPGSEYTDSELESLIMQYENSGWSGSPNPGADGTASTFGSYSSADLDAYVPQGGIYDPINNEYYALGGNVGIRGGKGGARKVSANGTFNWVTDGEDVVGDDGTVWKGGSTGRILTDVEGLPEAAGKLKAYGGNGAGAAVGIDRRWAEHINGGSDQETDWYIAEDD